MASGKNESAPIVNLLMMTDRRLQNGTCILDPGPEKKDQKCAWNDEQTE
jgi:hypothetical protein